MTSVKSQAFQTRRDPHFYVDYNLRNCLELCGERVRVLTGSPVNYQINFNGEKIMWYYNELAAVIDMCLYQSYYFGNKESLAILIEAADLCDYFLSETESIPEVDILGRVVLILIKEKFKITRACAKLQTLFPENKPEEADSPSIPSEKQCPRENCEENRSNLTETVNEASPISNTTTSSGSFSTYPLSNKILFRSVTTSSSDCADCQAKKQSSRLDLAAGPARETGSTLDIETETANNQDYSKQNTDDTNSSDLFKKIDGRISEDTPRMVLNELKIDKIISARQNQGDFPKISSRIRVHSCAKKTVGQKKERSIPETCVTTDENVGKSVKIGMRTLKSVTQISGSNTKGKNVQLDGVPKTVRETIENHYKKEGTPKGNTIHRTISHSVKIDASITEPNTELSINFRKPGAIFGRGFATISNEEFESFMRRRREQVDEFCSISFGVRNPYVSNSMHKAA